MNESLKKYMLIISLFSLLIGAILLSIGASAITSKANIDHKLSKKQIEKTIQINNSNKKDGKNMLIAGGVVFSVGILLGIILFIDIIKNKIK